MSHDWSSYISFIITSYLRQPWLLHVQSRLIVLAKAWTRSTKTCVLLRETLREWRNAVVCVFYRGKG